jgi:DNA modification methylase
MTVRILQGDCREVLATLPDASVQMVCTSPPYFNQRDYGVAGQIGLEVTPIEYVDTIVQVFREVRRVLRPDGTVFLNLGDSYVPENRGENAKPRRDGPRHLQGDHMHSDLPTRRDQIVAMSASGLKRKDLIGIPWMTAFALRADGWYLRSDVIWSKPNPMPESVTDRPTMAHEHVFLLTKSARYFYDADAVREEGSDNPVTVARNGRADKGLVGAQGLYGTPEGQSGSGAYVRNDKQSGHGRRHAGFNERWDAKVKIPGGWDRGEGAHGTVHRDGRTSAEYQEAEVRSGRNLRNVWTIATAPFPDAHFATFPPELAERCIKAGTSERGCCAACGAPWVRQVDRTFRPQCDVAAAKAIRGHAGQKPMDQSSGWDGFPRGSLDTVSTGWLPSCGCDAAVAPCTVLDPFAGAFTTAMVADRLQRNAIGIELSQDYCEIARRRLVKDAGMFAELVAS